MSLLMAIASVLFEGEAWAQLELPAQSPRRLLSVVPPCDCMTAECGVPPCRLPAGPAVGAAIQEPVPPGTPPGNEFATIPNVSPQPTGAGPFDSIAKFMDDKLSAQLASGQFAGAVAVVVKDGAVVFSMPYGLADVEAGVAPSPEETLFRAGSISKMFTWTAVMQLYEAGKLDLKADVNTYLHRMPPIPEAFGTHVSMANLMTHTGGFEDNKLGWLIAGSVNDLVPLPESLARHRPARVRSATTNFADGRDAAYSNWGAALAGEIVSEVSNLDFDAYVEANIFKKCGMDHATFVEPPPSPKGNVAAGYELDQGVLRRRGFEFFHNIGPAGSLSISANDMAKFMIAHLNLGLCPNGKRILDEKTAELMQARQLSPHPNVNGGGYGFVETYLNGQRTLGHSGKTLHFRSEMMLVPEYKLGIFVVYNSMPDPDYARETVNAFIGKYFSASLPPIDPPADFSQRAHEYEGSYSHNHRSYTRSEALLSMLDSSEVVATPNNTLMYNSAEWVEAGHDVFRMLGRQHTMAFLRNDRNEISGIVGPTAFHPAYRLGPHETDAFHAMSVVASAMIALHDIRGPAPTGWGLLLGALLLLAAAAAPRLGDGGNPQPAARWYAAGAALLAILIVAAVARMVSAYIYDFGGVLIEIPWYFRLATSILPIAFLLLTALVVYSAVRAWRRVHWSLAARIEYTVVAVLMVVFACWLSRWNLMPLSG